jgi:hypothetical protein
MILVFMTKVSGNIAVYPIEGLSPYQNKYFTLKVDLTVDGRFVFASRINPKSKNGIINVVKAVFSQFTLSMKQVKFVPLVSMTKLIPFMINSKREMYILVIRY